MWFRARVQIPHKTHNDDKIDLPFLLEGLESNLEIESLTTLSADVNYQHFILIGSTSKKLRSLLQDIDVSFAKRETYVQIEILEIKISPTDTNPSKRV